MTSVVASPVRVTARLDTPLSRWLWLVKWLLAIPHYIVLAFLWLAFFVLSVVAFFAILFTAHYPRSIFEFNVGVLRWTWRVGYYTYGALGTDRYPPFTLAEVPEYPATLEIAHPEHLSRGLALVKWWLLAVPHYLIVAFFVGGGSYAAYRAGTSESWSTSTWPAGGGLIGLLVLIAGVALLFTGRYPRGLFDLLLGMNRWVLRVAAYAALMTDAYPPFRLDLGGTEPAALAVRGGSDGEPPVEPGEAGNIPVTAGPPPQEKDTGPPRGAARSSWTTGRIVSVVLGSLALLTALGMAVGATALLVADRAGRDADGFLGTSTRQFSSAGHALVFDPVDLQTGADSPDLGSVLGDVRVRASAGQGAVFVGIGPSAAVDGYLTGVQRDRLTGLETGDRGRVDQQLVPGGPPSTPPGQQPFWAASASGPGVQQLIWPAASGQWAVVVMNADGSRPVVADLSAAVTAPALRWVWIGLYVGAGVALVVGIVLVALAVPRRVA